MTRRRDCSTKKKNTERGLASPLLINVAELLRRAGSVREVGRRIDAEVFSFDDPRIAADAQVEVGLTLEALTDGIVVHGRLGADWVAECRRCLRQLSGRSEIEVQELYQAVVSDPDAYPIVGEQLDLLEMVRENLLLAVPSAPLCKSDCPGLCPQCGADLQTTRCGCSNKAGDDRWAVLDQLKIDQSRPTAE
ncbi:MAG: DUF177 domain-containing protein [Actinobacteria bacterium]|nr:DUF177 domain-containing protein [Actinomycetota bacterium]